TRWTTPDTGTPTYNAIKMYRNYDGQKSTFGQTSVQATAPDVDEVAIFAAERADGALTIMAINKQLTTSASALITVTNFNAKSAQRWQLIGANNITRLPDQIPVQNVLSNTLPAQSITLFVLANTEVRISAPSVDASNLHLTLNGISGKNYALETATDFETWTRQQTNTAPAASFEVTVPRPTGTRFYRAVQLN
ncbi:MAG TPA: cellulase, partial [Verrucomicrobiae bacterium]|nr:cellulase [Verrucomicrobiae bacterium]